MRKISAPEVQTLLAPHMGDLFHTSQKRPEVVQLYLPFFHEDGDGFEIFLQQKDDGTWRIWDAALTLMRLSYSYELNNESKVAGFQRILAAHAIDEQDGELFVDVPDLKSLPQRIFTFAQALTGVSTLQYFNRETVARLFLSQIHEVLRSCLEHVNLYTDYLPFKNEKAYKVDFALQSEQDQKDPMCFVFGVSSSTRPDYVANVCYYIRNRNLKFESVVVLKEDAKVSKNAVKRLRDAGTTVYPSIPDFQQDGIPMLAAQLK